MKRGSKILTVTNFHGQIEDDVSLHFKNRMLGNKSGYARIEEDNSQLVINPLAIAEPQEATVPDFSIFAQTQQDNGVTPNTQAVVSLNAQESNVDLIEFENEQEAHAHEEEERKISNEGDLSSVEALPAKDASKLQQQVNKITGKVKTVTDKMKTEKVMKTWNKVASFTRKTTDSINHLNKDLTHKFHIMFNI